MLAHISRRLNINVNGTLFFHTILKYSTTTASATAKPHQKNHFLEEYLINSLGFSAEEASSASSSKKVTRLNPIKKDFNLILNFFQDLGFTKTQIKSVVFVEPRILFNDLDKTLKPKIRVLQDLGLSGSDLVKVLMGNKSLLRRGLDSHIKPQIEFWRNLLGSDDKVALALKRCSFLLGYYAPRNVARNVLLLRKLGFSDENVAKSIIRNPRVILGLNPEKIEEILYRVENYLGIRREMSMFFHGFMVMSSLRQSTVDMKCGILRSFGWSDADILNMFRNLPYNLRLSEAKMRKVLGFLMKELGYGPDYLASHPKFFSLSLEDRLKPRIEVMKILDEKKLNKRKASLYSVVCYPESRFVNQYLLPYKSEIPGLYESYTKNCQKR